MAVLEIIRGDDAEIDFGQIKIDGAVVDLTGWTLFFTAKNNLTDTYANAVVRKSSGELGGVVITDAENARSRAVFVPADTIALTNRVVLKYDVKAVSPEGKRYTVERGDLIVSLNVTDPPA